MLIEQRPAGVQSLIPGTHVKAWSATLPGFKHHAIVGWPMPDGTPALIHNTLPDGVSVTPLSQAFKPGQPIEIVQVPASYEQQAMILDRAYSLVGRLPWKPESNCEHFATWAFTGESNSHQLMRLMIGIAFACFLIKTRR